MDTVTKLLVNLITVIAWGMGIGLSVLAVAKGKRLQAEMGVSLSTYLTLVAVTEVVYTIGALMILASMGVNVLRYLEELDLWGLYQLIADMDVTTFRIIGTLGWVGFHLNRSISFVSPLYLLLAGREKLHPYFRASAWTEIGLEALLTILLFVTLRLG